MIEAICTVDVEDWFHVCDVERWLPESSWGELPSAVVEGTRRTLDLLARRNARATFFVLGWIARRYPGLVEEIVGAGHEIGCHGDRHLRVDRLGRTGFARDLEDALATLAPLVAHPIVSFRAPEWSLTRHTPWAHAELSRQGIRFSSSTLPAGFAGGTLPDLPWQAATPHGTVWEVPASVRSLGPLRIPYAGGIGLRLHSRSAAQRAFAVDLAAGRRPVLYLHPWEFVPGHPRVPLPPARAFVHYFRLQATAPCADALLARARFGGLAESFAPGAPRHRDEVGP